jgi:hypothetical protein
MRRILLVLLGFGVFAGYGSAIASARWHARNGSGCEGRWSEGRWGGRGYERAEEARPAVAPPAPAAQTVVVPQAAAAAPQIFLIMPGGQAPAAAPQVIVVPATPAPTAVPATPPPNP